MSLAECGMLPLMRISDERGDLGVVEGEAHVPFPIRRIYYLYNVAQGRSRGGHAHKALRSLLIAMSGCFEVVLDDGRDRKSFVLDRPDQGLYVSPMIWREIKNFSQGSVCLVLASELYDETDYVRDYETFLAQVKGGAE